MNEETVETEEVKEEVDNKFRLRTIISDQDLMFLRQESEALTADEIDSTETLELIQALKDFVVENDGLGMAAVQLGEAKQVFVMRQPFNGDRIITIINPRIIRGENAKSGVENCFSVPEIPSNIKGATVRRFSRVFVTYTDITGTVEDERLFVGMDARIFQHELDHLSGHLMLDDETPNGRFKGWARRF